MASPKILVVGSANMDMVVTVKQFPRPGETVFGNSFGMFPGGKGANQAVACAKLGGNVLFLGKMGKDIFRETLTASMKKGGVDLRHVLADSASSTGTALIAVDRNGQNEIVVVSGTNMKLTPADVRKKRSLLRAAKILLLQLETPLETVTEAVRLARRNGVITILNPAPARRLPASLLRNIDFLTPNETEAELMTGVKVKDVRSAEKAARRLLDVGVRHVIVTLGAKGCLLVTKHRAELFPGKKVKVVDTTAAGDAFSGGLAFALTNGTTIDRAIRFANAVAALSVTRMGAQSSMPTIGEVKRFAGTS